MFWKPVALDVVRWTELHGGIGELVEIIIFEGCLVGVY